MVRFKIIIKEEETLLIILSTMATMILIINSMIAVRNSRVNLNPIHRCSQCTKIVKRAHSSREDLERSKLIELTLDK